VLAAEVVAKSPPDGYTLLVGSAILWVTPMLRKAPFDVERDFSPIVLIERSPNIVTTHPSLPVKSMKELIALAKARPGELHYGSSGVASADHIIAELLKHMTGINIVHVPYKGIAPAHVALLSGEVQIAFGSIASSAPHVKSGRMRALAITSAQPSALVPGLPPIAETVPGFEAVSITGMWAPTKTPKAVIDRVSQEILRLLNQPETKARFLAAGVETVGLAPEQFAEHIKADIVRVGRVIKDAGIKVD
jgi:tripartite-type tricarboxylate transporter receptor subunit TctC